MNRPRYISILHAIGAILSVVSFLILLIWESRNPGILFCLAVAILILLEVPTHKGDPGKEILVIIYGSVIKGGMRRGIFIKEMFTIALLWLTIATYLFFHDITGAIANGVLTIALLISSIANEIEVQPIKRVIAKKGELKEERGIKK